MFRGFISADIGAISEIVLFENSLEKTGADLKLVEPENVHLTLKFLGETNEEKIDEICNVMEDSVRDVKKFKLILKSAGAFPNLNYPRVIWLGMENPESLIKIANHLEDNLQHLGFRKERRAFSPHVTVARVKTGRNKNQLAEILIKNREKDFSAVDIGCIRLKKSILSSKGPEYYTLKEISLSEI